MKRHNVRLPDYIAEELELNINNSKQYRLTPEQFATSKRLRGLTTPNKRKLVETIVKKDKKGNVISSTEKLQSKPIEVPEGFEIVKISTSKTTGQQWVQYKPIEAEKEVLEFDFEAIIKKYTKKVKRVDVIKQDIVKERDFDSLTYTDVHIGMDTNKDNNSMYWVNWNGEEVLRTAKLIIKKTLGNRKSNILVIDELGDLLDGYNGQTTRGSHELPQNMTNEDVFDCGLAFKMAVLDGLIPYYDEIKINNICNDNHAGSFGYFVNSAFKKIAELKYKNVKVANHRQFMNHYFVNDICFVITHGKDDKALKFGFKPHLDAKQIEKIDQYLKYHDIYNKSKLIIFKKGDSHQCLLDMCTSDDFFYFNYMALSPSSQWVQTNFKKGRRGFALESFKGIETEFKPIFIK